MSDSKVRGLDAAGAEAESSCKGLAAVASHNLVCFEVCNEQHHKVLPARVHALILHHLASWTSCETHKTCS